MSSLQKMTTNLCQVLRLHEYRNSNMPGLEKLGAIDIYYLEAFTKSFRRNSLSS